MAEQEVKGSSGISKYDPRDWGTHVVEVTLQWEAYTGVFHYEVTGNVKGLYALSDPADALLTKWDDQAEGGGPLDERLRTGVDHDKRWFAIELVDPEGNAVECEIWEVQDLEDMIVSLRIVDYYLDPDPDSDP